MKRTLALFASLAAVGCAAPLGSAYAPSSAVNLLPHEATYELLGRVAATSCGTSEFVKDYVNRSADKWHGHYRYLYESAKVQALDQKSDADVLLFVRSIEKITNGQYCVTVSGQAARITMLRAGGPAVATAKTSTSSKVQIPTWIDGDAR